MRLIAVIGVAAALLLSGPTAGAGADARSRHHPHLHPVVSGPLGASDLGLSWRVGCPVPPRALRRVTVTYVNFAGQFRRGSLVVHRDAVPDVLRFLRVALRSGFPFHRLGEARDGYRLGVSPARSDRILMRDNVTSAFNCRHVARTARWSWHAYGRAIDVNPVRNPYASPSGPQPPAGAGYLVNRRSKRGTLNRGDRLVQLLMARGWRWGGLYSFPDWQHFDLPR